MFASVSFALTKNLRWDICKNKVRIHVSLNFFKLMQVCANDQSGFGILPHKSQIGYRYRQLDIFCRFRMIYCRSMVHSYDVGTIFGPMFVQCIIRTIFVPWSYHVRTMFVQWPKKFVQCSYKFTTKVHTILYELLAIVWTLYKHCTLNLRNS